MLKKALNSYFDFLIVLVITISLGLIFMLSMDLSDALRNGLDNKVFNIRLSMVISALFFFGSIYLKLTSDDVEKAHNF